MISTSKQTKTHLLVFFLLFSCTINASCISVKKLFKEKPLIIKMNTDEHFGKFTEHGISKHMISVVYSHLDIYSEFMLSITNRSFYCFFNYQLDWVKYYYYTTIYCKKQFGGKKSDKQLLLKILSLALTKQDHVYFPQAPSDCQPYLIHTPLRIQSKFTWRYLCLSSSPENIEYTSCKSDDDKIQCSLYDFLREKLVLCTKVMKNCVDYTGNHKHFRISNVKIPILYVFDHVNNSHDEIIFFFQNCTFDYCNDFSTIPEYELTIKKGEDILHFFLTNRDGDKCFVRIEITNSLSTQCKIIGILSKNNPKHQYKLKNIFYLPSIYFSKD